MMLPPFKPPLLRKPNLKLVHTEADRPAPRGPYSTPELGMGVSNGEHDGGATVDRLMCLLKWTRMP